MEARRKITASGRRNGARWGLMLLILLFSALSVTALQTARELRITFLLQGIVSRQMQAVSHLQHATLLLTRKQFIEFSPHSRARVEAVTAIRHDLDSLPRHHVAASIRFHTRRADELLDAIARPADSPSAVLNIARDQTKLLREINLIDVQLRRAMAQSRPRAGQALQRARKWGAAFAVTLVLTLAIFFLRILFQAATQRRAVKTLADELQRDALTGWANRAIFIDAMDRGLAQASRAARHAAVLFLDLDRFKIINDRFGHAVGDEVLRQVTRRFSAVIRSGDLPARVGGDELAIFMPDLPDDAAAAELARRLIASLHDPLPIGGIPVSVGLSIGIAIFPANGQSAAELIDAADQAMYKAKQQGGGYAYHTAGVTAQVVRQQRLAKDLLVAVREDQLMCVFQPIFAAKSRYPVAVEALIRWRHPQFGVISPMEWLPMAQRAGVLSSFTPTIIEHALRELPGWRKIGWSPRVAINISACECLNADVPAILDECLKSFGLKGNEVELEITDNLLAAPAAIETLIKLRKMGVGIVMDDTSGGYPSLPTLNRLPLTRVKVDRTAVSQITRSARELELFSAFVALAHRLELQVIAEGVETESQVKAILATDCDFMQGHYFASAQDSDILARQIKQLTVRAQAESAGR